MFSEVLKIVPKLDPAAMASLERNLSSRFTKVAKKFGSGLKSAILGGGIVALAGGVINKLLNPLQETQAALDKILSKGDDLNTNAQQFNTTPGKLLKLQAAATGTGLDHENLNMLLIKFQSAIAEAKADPTKQTSVRKFANETDTAEAFFNFMQQLQKLDKNKQILVQQEVFGEKQIGKMSEFLNLDFNKFFTNIGAKGSKFYDPGAKKIGDLKDLEDQLKAQRELSDFQKKSTIVNKSMVTAQAKSENIALEQENKRLRSYDDLRVAAEFTEKMANSAENTYLFLLKELQGTFGVLTTIADRVGEVVTSIKAWRDRMDKFITGSRLFKGIFGGGDK